MQNAEFTRVPSLPLIVNAIDAEVGTKAVRRSFDKVGIPYSLARHPGSVLQMRQLFGLFEWFAREAGDGVFGVFAARTLYPEVYGPFVTYALQARTLRAAITRNNRGVLLHQRCSTLSLTEACGLATWTYTVDLPLAFGRHHHAVHTVIQMLAGMTKFLGFRPETIECGFEADRYGKPGELEDRIGLPIRWSCESNFLRFPSYLLDLPSGMAGEPGRPICFADLLRYARGSPPRTAVEKTTAIILQDLGSSVPSADIVARQLNIGVRTLQRRLDVEGTTFSSILDEVRRERAQELIREGNIPLWQVADALGYSDPAHFTRAYRRWHGFPPSMAKNDQSGAD